MFPNDLKTLSDDELDALNITFSTVFMLGSRLSIDQIKCVSSLSKEEFYRLSDLIDDEHDRREGIKTDAALERVEEDCTSLPESQVTDLCFEGEYLESIEYRRMAFKRAVCRLVRLIDLKAPDIIIWQATDIVTSMKKQLIEKMEKKSGS